MKNRPISIFVIFTILVSMNAISNTSSEIIQDKTLLIYTGNNAYHVDYDGFTSNYTGNTVINGSDIDLSIELTDEVDALLLPGNWDAFSTSQIDTIKDWYSLGEKLLWVAGDSDYGGYFISGNLNSILRGVGSHLRLDAGSIEDPVSNDGASYRVIANNTGEGEIATAVTEDISEVIVPFHGPTSIYGMEAGSAVDLRSTDIENVKVLISSSRNAMVLDLDISQGEDDFYEGIDDNLGNYPMLAIEIMEDNMVIASGEAIFSDYKNMYGNTLERAGTYHSGSAFVDNLISYFFDQIEPRNPIDQIDPNTNNFMIYTGGNPIHEDYDGFKGNYSNYPVIEDKQLELSIHLVNEIDVLFLPGNQILYREDLDAIKTWYELGDKLLWVAGDSDYGAYFNSAALNPVLEEIGSAIRLDAGAIEDPVFNDGSAYRVIANNPGEGPIADAITEGMSDISMIFHGPTSVFAMQNGNAIDLRSNDIDNIEVLISSSENALAFDYDSSETESDFYAGTEETGNYPMLVAETTNSNMIVVSGEVVFSDFKNMYGNTLEISAGKHMGSKIVDSIISYHFNPPEITTSLPPDTSDNAGENTTTTDDNRDNLTPSLELPINIYNALLVLLILPLFRKYRDS